MKMSTSSISADRLEVVEITKSLGQIWRGFGFTSPPIGLTPVVVGNHTLWRGGLGAG